MAMAKAARTIVEVLLVIFSRVNFVTATTNTTNAPTLDGQHFRITVLERGTFLKVTEQEDGTLQFAGFLIDMLDQLAAPHRANFTYELFTPSGLGDSCEPQLESMEDERLYSKHYRSQYNCGTNDVNDMHETLLFNNVSTDMYLGEDEK